MHSFLQTFLRLEEFTHSSKVESQPEQSIHENAVSVNQLTVYWPEQKNSEAQHPGRKKNGAIYHDKVNFNNH